MRRDEMRRDKVFLLVWLVLDVVLVLVLLVLTILVAEVFAPPVAAQEKFKFEVGPNFVGHRTTFEYPANKGPWFVSGISFAGNGLHISGSAKLSDMISVGARFDHNFFSNPTFFEITSKSERFEPNPGEQRGNGQRVEGFLGLRMPKVGILEAGVARHHFGRHWVYITPVPGQVGPEEFNNYWDLVGWGPVVGLTREVDLGSFTLGGGIWGYPRMVQSQEWSNDSGGTWRKHSESASGIKLEVTGNYWLSEKTAVKAGYQFFRMTTPDPVQVPGSWRIDSIRTEHAIIARYMISF